MRNRSFCSILLTIMLALSVGCTSPATSTPAVAPAQIPSPTAQMSETNLISGCVQNYDSGLDYFPEKVTRLYATGFTVEYFKNYKVVTVTDPYSATPNAFHYTLVQCGTPAPADADPNTIIEVPAKSIISLYSSYLPSLKVLGLYDKLVGVDSVSSVYDPDILQMAKDGKLIEVGFGEAVNVEQVLNSDPSLVMTGIYRTSKFNAYPQLQTAGIEVVINTDFLENTPLGRAEWVKFMSVFFNQEGAAEKYFSGTSDRYNQVATIAKAATNQPTVVWGVPGKDTWYVPGGKSFEATLLADAGAKYWWANNPDTGKTPLAFEEVFNTAANSDYWLAADGYPSMSDMLTADSRLSNFTAVANNYVYSNDARINDAGGNDYAESGVVKPDVVLSDLIKIFHPDLLPDYQLYYWRLFE